MASGQHWHSRNMRLKLLDLQREMERLARQDERVAQREGNREFPSIIISATDERLLVRAKLPGMNLQDLDMSITADTLFIQGARPTGEELEGGWYHSRERHRGAFARTIRLPADVDGNRAQASYVAGVLTISLPLREPAKPKQIAIQVSRG
jgi:HSP20 family protein